MTEFKRKQRFKRKEKTPTRKLSNDNCPVKSNPVTVDCNNHLSISNSGNNGDGKNGNLTYNQRIFCDEWLVDRNATRAYMVAYPNVKNKGVAAVRAHYLLKDSKIETYINIRLAEMSAKRRIDAEWVLERYERLVEYSVDDFFYNDGSMRPLSEIPKEKLYAICGLKHQKRVTTTQDDVIIENFIKEFKLPDKKAVLDSLAKWLKMFSDEPKGGDDRPNINYNIVIPESSDRVAGILGILLGSGLVQRRLIEDSRRESTTNRVIEAETD